jgi:hypothetical protein
MTVYDQVMDRKGVRTVTKRTVGRSYLLKGIACCVHCGSRLSAEAHRRGYSLYRHARGGDDEPCPADGRSIRAESVDCQADRLVTALRLPENWKESLEQRVASYDRIRTVEQQRASLLEKQRRLTNIYKLDNTMSDDEYARELQDIRAKLAELRIPEVDQAIVAGDFLDNMRADWASLSLEERHDALRFSACIPRCIERSASRIYATTSILVCVRGSPKPQPAGLPAQAR